MFAIVTISGFQEKVSEGDVLEVPAQDAKEGDKLTFDQVLLISDGSDVKLGTPLLSGATVTGEVVSHGRGDKIRVVKFRRRKRYTRTAGHRQPLTTVKITKISV